MGKMLRHALLLAALVCFGFSAAATAEWLNYSNPMAANDFVFDDGHAWIPALGGVSDLNPATGEFTVYTSSSGLPCSNANAAAISQDGVVWVAMTKGIGAIHPDGTVAGFYTDNSALQSDYGRAVGIGKDGLVWVGTDEGVYSYDGSAWTKYPLIAAPNMTLNNVIQVAADGAVWIGTEGGLRVFNGTSWTTYTEMNSGLPSGGGGNVRDIAFAPDGKTWFATYAGIVSFDGTDWEVFDHTNTPMMAPMIEAIAAATDGTIYAGHPNGVLVYDGTDWTIWNTDNSGVPANNITVLDVAPDGALWVGTSNGSAALKQGVWTPYVHSNYPELRGQIQRIAEDPGGVLWLATMGGGVVSKEGETFTAYTAETSDLISDMVTAVAVGADGSKWFGTWAGISHFDGTGFENYSFALGNFPVTGSIVDISIAPDGTPWAVAQNMAGPSNVCYFSDSEWQTLQIMALAPFSCVLVRENGDVYIGSNGQGLFVWNGSTTRRIDLSNGLPSNTVFCLTRDADDNVWAGTSGGLGLTDGALWRIYSMQNTMLRTNEIRAIYPAEDGSVWVSTGEGLVSIKANTSVRYSSQYSGLLVDMTTSVHQTASGDVAVGTLVGLAELTAVSYPTLTDGAVGPETGVPTTPFTFSVHYMNAEAVAGPEISVFVDSEEFELQLAEGEPNNGTYNFSTTLDMGMHGFYFVATDENGARTRHPFNFMLSGPTVGSKPAHIIIQPDKVLYVPGDPMQVLLTLINTLQVPLDITLYTAVELPNKDLLFFVYPDQFKVDITGLTFTLFPLQRIEDFVILDVVLEEAMLPYGDYAWMAACVDPNVPGFELLSDVSKSPWQFREELTPTAD
ncbi:MAG: hypothetical protein JW759_08860 [Candidatus Coatesbacteria bacterium]|nr:hypothetical protein [Candidatus Coatesbacteria bacterium]